MDESIALVDFSKHSERVWSKSFDYTHIELGLKIWNLHRFYGADIFDADIGAWDTSKVTSMSRLFYPRSVCSGYCFPKGVIFNQSIGAWDTSSVTDVSYMFYFTLAFDQDIGAWDTSSIMDMSGMFYSTDVFDKDIGAWDTSRAGQQNITSTLLQLECATRARSGKNASTLEAAPRDDRSSN